MSAFYKFPEDAILSLHTRILVHLSQVSHQPKERRNSHGSPPRMMERGGAGGAEVDGMDHDVSDTLAGEARRKGGLMRTGRDVCVQPLLLPSVRTS